MKIRVDEWMRRARTRPDWRKGADLAWVKILRVEHGVTLTGPFTHGYRSIGPVVPDQIQEDYEQAARLELERIARFRPGEIPYPTLTQQDGEWYGFDTWEQLLGHFDDPYLRGLLGAGFVLTEYHVPERDVRTSPIEVLFKTHDAVRLVVHTKHPGDSKQQRETAPSSPSVDIDSLASMVDRSLNASISARRCPHGVIDGLQVTARMGGRICQKCELKDRQAREDEVVLTGVQIMETLGIEPGPVVGVAYRFLIERSRKHGPMSADEARQVLRKWWRSRLIGPRELELET